MPRNSVRCPSKLQQRRLFLEPLESRSLLAIDLDITLTVTDQANGTSLPGVAIANGVELDLGDQYLLVATVEDLRTAPTDPGVLEAYLDLNFPAFAGTPGAVTINSAVFTTGNQTGNFSTGHLTEVGGGGNATGTDPTWLFVVPFTAATAGMMNFTADLDTASATTLRLADPVLTGEFTITADTVNVLPDLDPIAPPAVVNEDGAAFNVNLAGINGGPGGTVTMSAVVADPSLVSTSVVYTPGDTLGTVVVTPLLNAFGTTTVTVSAAANGAVRTRSFNVTITPDNDAPVVTPLTGTETFAENLGGFPVVIDATFVLTDVDSANFNGGSLSVTPVANAVAEDRVEIESADGILVAGNQVSFNGNLLGTFAGGNGINPLNVTFTTNDATPAAIQQLLRNITFRTLSDTPSELARTFDFVVTDGDGGNSATVSRTVFVMATNDDPVVALSVEPVTVFENAGPSLVAATSNVSDVDSPNFDGGMLSVSVTNAEGDETLAIRHEGLNPGQVGINGSDVLFGNLLIGSFTNGLGQPLQVQFNANATSAAVQAVVRNVTFQLTGENPSATGRDVEFQVLDGGGGVAFTTKTVAVVPVNDAPTMTLSTETVTYAEDAPGEILVLAPVIADVDSLDFDGGTLTVTVSANSEATDQLQVRNEGTAPAEIGVVGNAISFGGTNIGTFTGGPGAPLVITFNANATPNAVQALVGNITFSSSSQNPSVLTRTVTFTLVDGDGSLNGGSDTVTQTKTNVEVLALNDDPVLTLSTEPVTYTENQPAVFLAITSTLSDIDSISYDFGTLTVAVTNSEGNETLAVQHTGTGLGQIGVSGSDISYEGTIIGTFADGVGQPLSITFNAAATPAAVQALVRNLTFVIAGETVVAPSREISLILTDGAGGSDLDTKTLTIVPLNDAPTMTISGGPATYVENGVEQLIAATSTLTDDAFDLAGGTLTVDFTANGSADDRIELIEEGTAAGQIGLAGNSVTFGGTIFGTVAGGQGLTPLVFTFDANSSAEAVQALLRRISVSNVSDTPSPLVRTIRFTLIDGDGTALGGVDTAVGTTTANVTAVNDPPVVTLSTEVVSYSENGTAVRIANASTVTDVDSLNFDTGTLTVSITANGSADDRLEIRNEGSAAGQISTVVADIRFGLTIIGSFSGGDGVNPLVVTLNSDATPAAVNALMSNITFRSVSENPAATRTVQFVFNDGDGTANGGVAVDTKTKQVAAVAVNDAPVVTLAVAALAYNEGAAATVIDATAAVTDLDSANFDTGTLTVAFQTNGSADDRLEIRNEGTTAGLIGVNGTNVTFGGTTIGTFAGGSGTTALVVTFNSALATPTAVTALLKNITYRNVSDTPSTLPRTVRFTLVDGDGTANSGTDTDAEDKTINVTAVNDPPVVTLSTETLTYTENGTALILNATATVIDVDSTNFDTGTLTVSLFANGSADDRLEIRNQGTAADQIGVNGSNVTFGTTTIGTFAGGSGTSPLVVTLNANATPTATAALLRNFTYRNVSDNISALQRTVRFVLTDGDGTANGGLNSDTDDRLLTVVAVNDPPVHTLSTETVTFTEGQAAAAIISATGTVTDPDSADFSSGTLTVSLSANGSADDRLEIRNQGTAADQIGISGTNVTFAGTTIGTFAGGSGTTALVVTFNISATPAAVQALTRNITFRNVSSTPSVSPRTVSFVLNDGDGGTASDTDTKQISVVDSNTAPTVTLSTEAVSFAENGAAVVVATTATIADPDSADFNTGILTISISANGSADDRLTIRNQGTASGQIGVSGTNITFGGTTIGTFAGGTGTTPLTVTLNASANVAATQALLRNVLFSNISENPTTEARTISATLSDGDGATSPAVTKSFAVTAVNDGPVNTVPAAQATAINVNKVFNAANGNKLSISDLDAGNVQVTLNVTNGTLSLAGVTGLTFTAGTGTNDTTMTFTGSLANANTAIDGLTFKPTTGFAGSAILTMTTSDLGNTGSGGTLTDTDTVTVGIGNSFTGSAYIDSNGNGVRNTGEIGLPNVTVSLLGLDPGNANISLTTTTNADGNFTFNTLPAGRFQLTQTPNTNFTTIGSLVTEVTATPGQDVTGISLRSSGIRPELITINHFLGSTPSARTIVAGLSPAAGQPLLLARPTGVPTQPVVASPVRRTLALPQAEKAIQAAASRWVAAAGSAAPEVVAKLAQVQVQVADLPGDTLALAQQGLITFDVDAGGQGWFVDETPQENEEYFSQLGQLVARDATAAERVDLLTVAAHELGHLLGLEDVSSAAESDLLAESLLPGVRKEINASVVDLLFGKR